MVRKTPDTPQFAEQFINYGFNKVQWVEHLRYSGYEFHVLSHAYAIDMPHPEYMFIWLIIIGLHMQRSTCKNFKQCRLCIYAF